MVIHEKAEKEQKRSRRVVQLNYLAVLPLLSLAGFYISATSTEAKKREAGHPVISKVGLWRQ